MIKFLRIVSLLLLLFIAVMVFMFMPMFWALMIVALYIVYAILSSKSRMDTSNIQDALVDLLDAFKDDWNKPVGRRSILDEETIKQMITSSLMMERLIANRVKAKAEANATAKENIVQNDGEDIVNNKSENIDPEPMTDKPADAGDSDIDKSVKSDTDTE